MEQPPVDAQWESVDEFENSIYMDPDYLLGAVYCTYDVWSGEYKAYGDPYFIERYYSTEAEYPPAYETPASAVSGEPMTYEEYFSLERSVQGNYTTWESGRYDWTDGTVRFFLEDGMVRREYLPDGTIDDICAVQSELNPEGFFYVYSNCRIDWSEYAPEYTQTAVNAYGMTLEEWNIYENGYRPTSVRRIYNAKTDYSMVCGEESILEKYYPDEKPVKTVTRIYGPDGKIKKP